MGEIILNRLPRTLEELKEMPQAGLTRPEEVAAISREGISDAFLFLGSFSGE